MIARRWFDVISKIRCMLCKNSAEQMPIIKNPYGTVTLMEIEKIRSSLGGENFLTELKLRANPGLLDDVCSGLAAALDSSSGSKRSREE